MAAFVTLHGSRGSSGFGPDPIPLGEIESYCRLFGWNHPEDRIELVEIIGTLDQAFLETAAKRREVNDGSGNESPAPRRRQ